MSNQTLADLYAEHEGKVSDKWSLYLAVYERLFRERRDKPIRMLEIGVQNGGSLEIWSKYFPGARKFIGCDINSACSRLQFDDARIKLVVGDANTDQSQSEIIKHSPDLDIVIDDGSHRSSDIVKSFARYFPRVVDGGIFVAEDLHCSYWREFEGGLYYPLSAIAFFKHLADVVNHEHWGLPKSKSHSLRMIFDKYGVSLDEDVLERVHSVEFVNSMCIVRKEENQSNLLGPRLIAGKTETVTKGVDVVRGTRQVPPPQSSNLWSARELPPPEELLLQFRKSRAGNPEESSLALKTEASIFGKAAFRKKSSALAETDRVALLASYSPDGSIKPHVAYYVSRLASVGFRVILVIACDEFPANQTSCEQTDADFVALRENRGFDFGSWAHAFQLLPELFEVKSCLLTNDSLFGPFSSFDQLMSEIFANEGDIELQGLTLSIQVTPHAQSYFLHLSKRLLHSEAFRTFIASIRPLVLKKQIIALYEVPFTHFVSASGFRVGARFEAMKLGMGKNHNPTNTGWKELIKQGFPFIKIELLRDNPGAIDISDWQEVLQDAGYDIDLALNYLESVRSNE